MNILFSQLKGIINGRDGEIVLRAMAESNVECITVTFQDGFMIESKGVPERFPSELIFFVDDLLHYAVDGYCYGEGGSGIVRLVQRGGEWDENESGIFSEEQQDTQSQTLF